MESGMEFECPSQTCFQFEKSKTYDAIKNGVKIADFLFLQKKKSETAIWCVEAKSSSPRPGTQPNFDALISEIKGQIENQRTLAKFDELILEFKNQRTLSRFDEFVLEIKDKLLNAFSLYVAMRLKRHSIANELLPEFETPELSTVKFQFILVIAGHKPEWLPPLRDALYNALYPTSKTWNLGQYPVIVINDDKAREKGLIQ